MSARRSLPGLLLALLLLSGFALAIGALPGDSHRGLQATFALGLNAGVVPALLLLPSRRQLPALLLIVEAISIAVRLLAEPVVAALPVTLASLPALLGCGLAGATVNAVAVAGLTGLATTAGLVTAAQVPSIGFIFGIRLAAVCDGVVTVMPLMLMLMRRHPGSWPWTTWVEIGSWLAVLSTVSLLVVQFRQTPAVGPLALLATFAGLVFAVLRRGSLAAAVLTPAFAVAAAAMLVSFHPDPAGSRSVSPILFSQLAGLLAGLLAWAVATVVTQRETARRLAHSQEAAAQALTTLQAALLPPQVTSPPGIAVAARYRAAGAHDQIGGDWYDTIALPAGGTALVIGDVEGHDLTAASVMGLVRGAVRSYALEGHPPRSCWSGSARS